jgi:hypothetical protein
VAAGAVAFVGFGIDYLHSQSADDSAGGSSTAGDVQSQLSRDQVRSADRTPQILDTGTDYSLGTLAAPAGTPSATEFFAPRAASPPTQRKETPDRTAATGPDPLARLRAGQALQQCLDAIATENGSGPISALSVDYARFNGSPAVVVRFSANNGDWAWASGSTCGVPGGGAATLDKVPVR